MICAKTDTKKKRLQLLGIKGTMLFLRILKIMENITHYVCLVQAEWAIKKTLMKKFIILPPTAKFKYCDANKACGAIHAAME